MPSYRPGRTPDTSMTAEFRFDPTKTLDENYGALLDALASDDEEMAAILRANASALARIVRDGERDSSERATFNSDVAAALDALAAAGPEREA
jgi:hypothetical protein